ncbi:ANTAR domain-containing protein [Streptomyces sp. Ru71]|uniref:ANTAR domain-containing protein n=1 Tax=Streptomyces sp. Ru71 TaxID=2080746 RepID=UPI00215662ED|nr:ANTAR domain-containing protein [Streptomyces sp. Ru71]
MDVHADRLPGALREPQHSSVRIAELEATVAQLRQAMVSHAVIDQAIGVVVAVGRVTPAEAWDALRETSMCTNVKLRRVAEQVVAWGTTGELDPDIRAQLAARLGHRTPR